MRNLLSVEDLDATEILDLLSLARNFDLVQKRSVPKVPALRGKTVVLAFFEDSTRTRTSFDLAARRLSADVVNFSAGSSSVKKGESLRDTIETINAMGVSAIVIRHASSGVASQITRWTDAAVINAGDGWHQHPTQALLDAYTITEKLGSLQDKRITLCGDIQHSRVARSNVQLFSKLGARVTLVAPKTLLPAHLENWPASVSHSLEETIAQTDVLYMLRIQNERMGQSLLPSAREYRDRFGLTIERLDSLSQDSIIMHPGPMNRGVEIDPEVIEDSRVVVLDQVSSGVSVRMAVLFATLGPGQFDSIEGDASHAGELSGGAL